MLQAAKLWERTSARGTKYFSGRLGGVKIVILPNRDFAEGDPARGHSHLMYFADGAPAQPTQPAQPEGAPAQPTAAPAGQRARPQRGGPRRRLPDDVMPF